MPFVEKKDWIGLLIAFVAACMLIAIGLVLLGIPGALIFEVFSAAYNIVTGISPMEQLGPDGAWPMAIFVTVVWPLSIIPSYVIAFMLLKKTPLAVRILVFAFLLCVAAVLTPAVLYFISLS